MSFSGFLAIVLAVNLVCAVIAAFMARKWGRDPFGWVLVCGVLGPFGLVALVAARPGAAPRPAPLLSGTPGRIDGTRVLVPVDGSEQALFAVRHVAENMQESEAVLITVLPLEREEGAAAAHSSVRKQQMEAEAAAKLASAEEILRAAGVAFRTEIAFGDPAQQILDAAAAGPFDLIVMGRRGGGLSRALLGSVSDRVVKNAETPVTLVG